MFYLYYQFVVRPKKSKRSKKTYLGRWAFLKLITDTDFLTFVSHMPELDSLIGQEPKICPLKCAETPPSCSENIILLPR